LKYLADKDADKLMAQVKSASACLYGLIRAVEKEAGGLKKAIAAVTSAMVLCLSSIPRL
jgi:hypothetical protein